MMRSSIAAPVCSLIVALTMCSSAKAEEQVGGRILGSPQAVLDAYAKAIAERDLPTIFALGTSDYQNEQLLDIVAGAIGLSFWLTQFDEQTLSRNPEVNATVQLLKDRHSEMQAILARHVVDWERMSAGKSGRRIAQSAHNGPEARARAAADIARDIKDKTGLFAEMHVAVGTPGAAYQTRIISQNGSTATAELTSTINLIEARRDPRTNATAETERTVKSTATVYLTRITGRWYISAKDEEEGEGPPVLRLGARNVQPVQEIPALPRPPQDPPAAQAGPNY
jgi:hypothetical protein